MLVGMNMQAETSEWSKFAICSSAAEEKLRIKVGAARNVSPQPRRRLLLVSKAVGLELWRDGSLVAELFLTFEG